MRSFDLCRARKSQALFRGGDADGGGGGDTTEVLLKDLPVPLDCGLRQLLAFLVEPAGFDAEERGVDIDGSVPSTHAFVIGIDLHMRVILWDCDMICEWDSWGRLVVCMGAMGGGGWVGRWSEDRSFGRHCCAL